MARRLVCIIPQVRNPSQTWGKFKENVIDVLEADLLLCVGDSTPRAQGVVIQGAEGTDDNEYFRNARYVFRRSEPVNDWSEAYDEMSTEWRHFAHIPEGWLGPAKLPRPHKYTGGIILFYRWYLYKTLKENDLLAKYDQIIVTRSDYYWIKPHPILDLEHVWFPNGEFHGGLCDRHVVFPSKFAEEVLRTGGTISLDQLGPMVQFYNSRVSTGFGGEWMYNIETYLYFRYVLANLTKVLAFFPQKMVLASLPENSAKDTFNPKYGVCVRYAAELEDVEKDDEPLITWPWKIDHYHMRHGMFTGKAFRIPSSSDVSENGASDAETR
jgi:hypothetical protein